MVENSADGQARGGAAGDAESGETERPEKGGGNGSDTDTQAPRQSSVALENLDAGAVAEAEQTDLESILEIPVKLSMEIGQTRISIRNLLQLGRGSVVELNRSAGEPMDVMVNGVLVAHGEVVVVNEKFGIRLTDVVSARERVSKLG